VAAYDGEVFFDAVGFDRLEGSCLLLVESDATSLPVTDPQTPTGHGLVEKIEITDVSHGRVIAADVAG